MEATTTSSSTLRNRKPGSEIDIVEPRVVDVLDQGDDHVDDGETTPPLTALVQEQDEYDRWSVLMDVIRVLLIFIAASCAISYLMSGGESWAWGMRNKPRYLRSSWWKAQLVSPLPQYHQLPIIPSTNPMYPITSHHQLYSRSTNSPSMTALTQPDPSTSPSTAPSLTSRPASVCTVLAAATMPLPAVTPAAVLLRAVLLKTVRRICEASRRCFYRSKTRMCLDI